MQGDSMKYYSYQGKVYKSHNKEALCRRLFVKTIGPWGEKKIRNLDEKKAEITRLFRYDPQTKTGDKMKRKKKLTTRQKQAITGTGRAQAWFKRGEPFAGITATDSNKKTLTKKVTKCACPKCGPVKFKTVNKTARQFRCRKCDSVVQD
jgi:predicted RNA-binding Zn-ribbon protein involved in translation (DUF1610 family)